MTIARMMAGTGSGAWDITRLRYVRSFAVGDLQPTAQNVVFKPDGTAMFVVDNDQVVKYTLPQPWNVLSATYSSAQSLLYNTPVDVAFKDDGTKMYVLNTSESFAGLVQYNLPTPWSFASSSIVSVTTANSTTNARAFFFKPDGTKLYIAGDNPVESVSEYNLPTPWSTATTNYVQKVTISDKTVGAEGVFFRPDGMRMYVSGRKISSFEVALFEYKLSSAWAVSSATYFREVLLGSTSRSSSAFFKPDGKRFYSCNDARDMGDGFLVDVIDEYTLTGELSTATSVTYAASGTYSFVVPTAVTSITARLVGGSGGGASGYTVTIGEKNPVDTNLFGGDGGSGALATKALAVTPGETLTIVVGSGGAGGVNVTSSTPAPGSDGADSTVTQSAVVVARADAGSGAPGASDGAGGLAASSTGDTTTNGVTGAGGAGGFGENQSGATGASGFVTITW